MSEEKKRNVAVYCGAALGNDKKYKEITEKLGKWMTDNNYNLVYGGGKAGLMGSIADSVLENGGEVIGIIPEFLTKRELSHDKLTKLVIVETMSERKKMMADLSEVFIALPGGPGTLEEITEVVSWAILSLHKAPCIFFNYDNYYTYIKEFYDNMVDKDYLAHESREKIYFTDSFEEMEKIIKNYEPPKVRVYF